jgi:hypothetical protein
MASIQKAFPLTIALFISANGTAYAEPISPPEHLRPRVYTCRDIAGSYMGPATAWKPEADGSTNQKVQLMINEKGKSSTATWFDDTNTPYWVAEGVAFDVPGGFALVSVSEQNIETYTLLVSSLELMNATTRIGGSNFPIAIKGQRGTCTPRLD